MTGRLSSVVFDCSDPHRLAHFYSELLGLPVTRVDGDWVDIGDGQTRLSFQHAPGHQPPRWPDPAFPQQVHLDIHVDDIAAAEAKVLALGRPGCPAPSRGSGSTPTRPVIRSAWNAGNAPARRRPAPGDPGPAPGIWLSPDLSVLPYDPRWFLYRGLAHLAGHPVCLTRRLIWGRCRRRCRRKLPERHIRRIAGCRALT